MHFTFGVGSRRLGPDNVLVGWVIKDDTTWHTNVHVNVVFTFSELHYLRLDAYFGASVVSVCCYNVIICIVFRLLIHVSL